MKDIKFKATFSDSEKVIEFSIEDLIYKMGSQCAEDVSLEQEVGEEFAYLFDKWENVILEVDAFPKNKLITIGYLGQKQCYLNINEGEAIKKYCQSEGMSIEEFNKNGIKINIIEFQDEFWAYDVSD